MLFCQIWTSGCSKEDSLVGEWQSTKPKFVTLKISKNGTYDSDYHDDDSHDNHDHHYSRIDGVRSSVELQCFDFNLCLVAVLLRTLLRASVPEYQFDSIDVLAK